MSVFMDLNIRGTLDKKKLQRMIEKAAHLGYSTVAINYVYDQQQNKKEKLAKPPCISELFDKMPIIQGKSRPIKVLNRLTVVATQASHFRPTAEYKFYDIIAVLPKSEKLFHAACMTYDVDIICMEVTEKQPFFFKRSPVNGAIERGVFFEISYTPAIRDSTMRRYTISNSLNLVDSCKGKNIILSSGAENVLDLRGPYDIANLALLFGLSEGDAKSAVSTSCRSVHLHGETRKTAMGIIHTMKKDETERPKGERPEEERPEEERPEEERPEEERPEEERPEEERADPERPEEERPEEERPEEERPEEERADPERPEEERPEEERPEEGAADGEAPPSKRAKTDTV